MRLYAGKVASIATEVVRVLTAGEQIDVSAPREAEADVASVLTQYLNDDREASERAKEIIESTGRSQSEFGRIKALAAAEKGIKTGDEALDYLLDQVVEMLHYSQNIDEIFCEDVELRRLMAPVFKKHMAEGDALDGEVRAQLRHLKEGTRDWDIEYGKVMELTRRKKGL